MSEQFSIQKSIQKSLTFCLFLVGATGALLGARLLSSGAQLQPAWSTEGNIASVVLSDQTAGVPTNANTILIAASPSSPEAAESVGVGALLAVAAIGGTAAGVILTARKANHPLINSNQNNRIQIDQASSKLQKQLLRLLHNDRETANRLLAQIKLNHPNQSVNWAMEKAIYDLERDRH